MHEMHLMKDLFADLLKHAQAQQAERVTKVFLEMGEFTEINEEVLGFFFEEKSRDTVLQGAELVVKRIPQHELRLVSFDCE